MSIGRVAIVAGIVLVAGAVLLARAAHVTPGTTLLPVSAGPALAQQCSRPSFHADSFWAADPQQAAVFDQALRALLARSDNTSVASVLGPLAHYHRQLLGYSSGGKQYLYANFYRDWSPAAGGVGKTEAATAMIVCDGGASYWGATYSLAAHAVVLIDTNGSIGGGACHWQFSAEGRLMKGSGCQCMYGGPRMQRPYPPLPSGFQYCKST